MTADQESVGYSRKSSRSGGGGPLTLPRLYTSWESLDLSGHQFPVKLVVWTT